MPDAAVESYQQALQFDRQSGNWRYNHAHCRAEVGHYGSALAASASSADLRKSMPNVRRATGDEVETAIG
jgi:hypothetical protein